MGFWDVRCMATGLSLHFADTNCATFLLVGSADSGGSVYDSDYQPLALPLRGTYNRLGSIDLTDESLGTKNAKHLREFFAATIRDGRLTSDFHDLERGDPLETVLLIAERTTSEGGSHGLLDGHALTLGFVCEAAFETVASSQAAIEHEPAYEPLFMEIYPSRQKFGKAAEQFERFANFMDHQELAWYPDFDGCQHYEEMIEYYEDLLAAGTDDEIWTTIADRYWERSGSDIKDFLGLDETKSSSD